MDARHHTIKKSKNNKKTKITQHVIPFTSRRSESVELLFQKYTLNIKVSGPWDTNRRDATPTKALRIRSGCDSNWCVCVCVSRISRSVDFPPTSFVICTRSSPRIRIRRFRTGYLDGWPLCCVFFPFYPLGPAKNSCLFTSSGAVYKWRFGVFLLKKCFVSKITSYVNHNYKLSLNWKT